MTWLFGAPLAAAGLHTIEEFAPPGGFADSDRRYRPAFARAIRARVHVVIPALLLVLGDDLRTLRRRHR